MHPMCAAAIRCSVVFVVFLAGAAGLYAEVDESYVYLAENKQVVYGSEHGSKWSRLSRSRSVTIHRTEGNGSSDDPFVCEVWEAYGPAMSRTARQDGIRVTPFQQKHSLAEGWLYPKSVPAGSILMSFTRIGYRVSPFFLPMYAKLDEVRNGDGVAAIRGSSALDVRLNGMWAYQWRRRQQHVYEIEGVLMSATNDNNVRLAESRMVAYDVDESLFLEVNWKGCITVGDTSEADYFSYLHGLGELPLVDASGNPVSTAMVHYSGRLAPHESAAGDAIAIPDILKDTLKEVP